MANRRAHTAPDGRFPRRTLLAYAGSAGIGLPLIGGCTRAEPAAGAPRSEAPRARVALPVFTKAERDRRWAAVRAIMSRAPWNLEAILVPSMSDQAYVRYLTQIGGRAGTADLVFPRDPSKPVVALTGGGRNAEYWRQRLGDWIADGKLVVDGGGGASDAAEALTRIGAGAAGTRVGVAKLTGSRFDSEGLVSVTYLDKVKGALPNARFVSIEQWGTDAGPVDGPAMVKSAEEHEVVRAAVAASESAVATLVATARGAKRQADLWFPTFYAMFVETGEDPTRLSISLDQPSNSTLGAPTTDPVAEGQIVSQEIDATVQGYRAQVNHSFFIGGPRTPGYAYYAEAIAICAGAFSDALAFIVPGRTTCGELVDRYAAFLKNSVADDEAGVVLHSSGLGNLSRPRLGPMNSKEDGGIVLQPGMTFNFKPAVRLKRGHVQDARAQNRVVQLGDHVLVTERGAVRLGQRALAPLHTET